MLHLRRGRWARVTLFLGGVRDDLAASDPGLLRLLLAVRGVLSVSIVSAAAVVAGQLGHFSPAQCASGIVLSMMGPFLSQEPTRAQRQRTLVALLLPAVGANVATAVLHGHGAAGDSLFLLLVFVCVLLAPLSPRGIGLGLVAIVTIYIGLYLDLPRSTLPVQIASQAAAIPVIAFACFVLVPVNPAATLRRTAAAVQARAAQVIRHVQAAGSGQVADLRRDLLRLNQLALAADDQAALLDPAAGEAVRARLVDVELWTARLVDLVNGAGAGSRGAVRLGLHARRIGRGRPYTTQPADFVHGTTVEALVGLGNAVHGLGAAARTGGHAAPGPARPFVPGPLAWRMAVRVTAAAGLAMAGGMALSPQRWFWAVITVYVVFLNARSRGDTIYRGVQRLGGTVAGIGAGLVLATTVAGDLRVETATLIVSVFGMFYFFLVSYATGIFFVTVMLGVLYGMLGAPLETVLVLRLEETAIGAAAAVGVAVFVLPSRTRDQVQLSGRAVLSNLAAVVQATAVALAGPPDPARPPALAAMRAVDRSLADLRLALAPLVAGRMLLRRTAAERPVSSIADCVHWARMLAAESEPAPLGPARRDLLADVTAVVDRLGTLARGGLAEGDAPPLRSGMGSPSGRAVHGLYDAVGALSGRLEIGAYEAFAFNA